MNILKSWLQDYVDVKVSDQELSDKLTFSGTLVEEIFSGLDVNIIVAQIKEVFRHPIADKLRIAKVTNGTEELQIVCGAPNIEPGQIVPLATIGAQIGDFTIKEAEIRGEKSFGMMCSKRELGLGEDHEGIYILSSDYTVGESLNKYIDSDTVFELEITPNRGDCLSHLGVAREAAALLGEKLKLEKPQNGDEKKTDFSVEIQNPETCFKYLGAKISGVKVAPSPKWLQDRLTKVGLNPINNVVDITNYIMMDLGQPMHAFDRAKIHGDKIIVKEIDQTTEVNTLDGEVKTLQPGMVVICDTKGPIAIGGVMGLSNSEVTDATTELILESAVFERKSIRKTAKDLAIMSDASYRFERGVDLEITKIALDKAIKMIEEICGGKFDGGFGAQPAEQKDEFVKVEYSKTNELLGLKLTDKQIDEELQKVGFELKDGMAKVPSWRHDVSIWEDLAEEVVRLYGMEKVDKKAVPTSAKPERSDYFYKEHFKDYLVAQGFVEVFNYPFISSADIATLGLEGEDLLEVANPIQKENKFMRNSLKVGLMRNIAKNPTFEPVMLFEIANVFTKTTEESHIGVVVSGKGAKKAIDQVASDIKAMLSVEVETVEATDEERAKYKIKKPNVFSFEVKTAELIEKFKAKKVNPEIKVGASETKYRKVSKFPPAVRDLAFLVDEKISSLEIKNSILDIAGEAVLVELFDEFASDKLGAGKKSVAYHIYLQELDKTMADTDADRIISKIIDSLKEKFGAELRS